MSKPDNRLIVKCPKCKDEFNYYESAQRPFCSEKCKMVDLGHWFTESYSVESEAPPEIDEFELLSGLEGFDAGH